MFCDKENFCCFGNIEKIFPVSKDGLRITQEVCMSCFCKVDCLKIAMNKNSGIAVRAEFVRRAYSSGMLNFFRRWLVMKELNYKKIDV